MKQPPITLWCFSLFRRPGPKQQRPLPAWDQNDNFGNVATTAPPELVIPAKRDILFFRADFAGVTLPGTYSPTAGGWMITSGRWNGLFIPYINGANTTPPTMIMTTQLVLYPRKVQDAVLTEHAERNYDRIIWSGTDPWENAPIPLKDAIAFGQYVKSWGFWNCIWKGNPNETDPDWAALVSAGCCDYAVFGEEVDGKVSAEQYCASLRAVRTGALKGIPTGAHFSAGPRGGYPIDPQRDTFLQGGETGSWAEFDGWLHLMLQSNQDHSAGRQAAVLLYARHQLQSAPNSTIALFETMATAQLYGTPEEVGCLRSLEMLYAPGDPGMNMLYGSGNGLRFPDGSPV